MVTALSDLHVMPIPRLGNISGETSERRNQTGSVYLRSGIIHLVFREL